MILITCKDKVTILTYNETFWEVCSNKVLKAFIIFHRYLFLPLIFELLDGEKNLQTLIFTHMYFYLVLMLIWLLSWPGDSIPNPNYIYGKSANLKVHYYKKNVLSFFPLWKTYKCFLNTKQTKRSQCSIKRVLIIH